MVFVEDYDINVCRHMIQGVDVWLNNPRRPLEASGTSGQKAVLNGGLNLSVLDGWWAEAYDGTNGFAIGKGHEHVSDEHHRPPRRAPILLPTCWRRKSIPLFYERDVDGLPRHWIQRMMNSISSLAWRFSAHRMVMDYVEKRLSAGRRRHELRNEHAVGRQPGRSTGRRAYCAAACGVAVQTGIKSSEHCLRMLLSSRQDVVGRGDRFAAAKDQRLLQRPAKRNREIRPGCRAAARPGA